MGFNTGFLGLLEPLDPPHSSHCDSKFDDFKLFNTSFGGFKLAFPLFSKVFEEEARGRRIELQHVHLADEDEEDVMVLIYVHEGHAIVSYIYKKK